MKLIKNNKLKTSVLVLASLLLAAGLSACGSAHPGGGHHIALDKISNKNDTDIINERCHSSMLSYILSNKPYLISSSEIDTLPTDTDSSKSASVCVDLIHT